MPTRRSWLLPSLLAAFLLSALPGAFETSHAAEPAALEPPRPRLQILNGSQQPLDLFWLKSDTEREPRGSIEPGRNTILTTTLGHRFALVGREDRSERIVTSRVPVQAVRFDPPDKDGVPGFYTQRVDAHGYPIVASARVNPYALKEAVYLVDQMLAKRPDVRDAMIRSGSRLCILAWDEFTTDQPEFAWLGKGRMPEQPTLSGREYWDSRARGLGGSETDPFCSCGEENLLCYPGDPYSTESILIHEFAHNMHLRGLLNVDPTFDSRLKATYDASMKAGLWRGKYASVNHHEYFAEGVQSWFDNNRENDHDHNHVNTRDELIEYDPGLAAMCREVFGDTVLKYTKPQTRVTGHLDGWDPATSPKFEWPDRLKQAKDRIRAAAQARSEAANGDSRIETRIVAGWKVHIRRDLLAKEPEATRRALELLEAQLAEIVRAVPAAAVERLKEVPLHFSPAYPGRGSGAEYHPDAGWLRSNGRDPAMARAVEFSGVADFEAETRRMPNFVLHELAHGYHHRTLPAGFDNPEVKAAYDRAKAGGGYDRVERSFGEGNGRPKTFERAYALTSPMEYFAEATEAYFARNDFFPFTRDQLKAHDPGMFELVGKLWGVAETK